MALNSRIFAAKSQVFGVMGISNTDKEFVVKVRSTYSHLPKVLFHKGDKKPDINQRLVDSLSSSVTEVRAQLTAILDKVETLQQGYEQRLASIFVPVEKVAIALDGITEQISQLKLRIKDCERLEALCK